MSLTFYLGRPEAEGCRLDISFLFVHQQQRLVFYHAQILPCGHMSQSEWLTPTDMTPTPPGHMDRNPKKVKKPDWFNSACYEELHIQNIQYY